MVFEQNLIFFNIFCVKKEKGKTTCMFIHASLMIITILLTSSTSAIADDTIPICDIYLPIVPKLSTLDPALVAAEHAPQVVIRQDHARWRWKTITDAINSILAGNTKRVFVYIKTGVYNEKITITNNKPFVTFYGSPKSMPNITFDGTTQIWDCAYRYQDTLYDYKGLHLFKDCFIKGSVDFIFGKGKSLYLNTEIHVVKRNLTVITAQQRDSPSEDSGFSFVHCKITGTTYARRTYLGRAWGSSPNVVVACTDIAILSTLNVNRKQILSHCFAQLNLLYGEYNNWGQGSNITSKARYTRKLSDAEAKPFISLGNIQGSKWLLPR
ncbi:unnamed protein product [Malus baccata var. baccata]